MKIGKSYILSKSASIEFDPIFENGFSIRMIPQAYLTGSGIYKLVNLITKECYVGATKNFYKRLRNHKCSLNTGNCKHPKLIEAVKKYGLYNFDFVIIEHVEIHLLAEKEQYYIDQINPEYNTHMSATSAKGHKRSDEFKEKVRKSITGIKHPKWRNDIKSKAQGGENHWTKKKSYSEEAKLAMSIAQKKLYKSGYKNPNIKNIVQYDENGVLIAEHESYTSAAKSIGVTPSAIGCNVRGMTKTCRGFVFKLKK